MQSRKVRPIEIDLSDPGTIALYLLGITLLVTVLAMCSAAIRGRDERRMVRQVIIEPAAPSKGNTSAIRL